MPDPLPSIKGKVDRITGVRLKKVCGGGTIHSLKKAGELTIKRQNSM